MTGKNDITVKYDLMFLLSPALTEERAGDELTRIIKAIETQGGVILSQETPRLRPLAYPVVKTWEGKKSSYDQALFGFIKLEIIPSELPKIVEDLKTIETLLRSAFTYAYLDVRPVRRLPTTDGDSPVDTTERVIKTDGTLPVSVDVSKPELEAVPKAKVSEAEIDKQIDDLLA